MKNMTEDVTALLMLANASDDPETWNKLSSIVYEQLRWAAERVMRYQRADHTLQPSALVNEYWLRLLQSGGVASESRSHFYCVAAGAMRHILIDYERRDKAKKRKGGKKHVSFQEDIMAGPPDSASNQDKSFHVAAVNRALENMKSNRALRRAASVFEWRVVLGRTTQEVGEMLQISTRTVKRDLQFARAWLTREIKRAGHHEPGEHRPNSRPPE